MSTSSELAKKLLEYQRSEITEHAIYTRLASVVKSAENQRVLSQIGQDELRHYEMLKRLSGRDVGPDRLKVFLHYWMSRIMGLTFGLKWMERQEKQAQDAYRRLHEEMGGVESLVHDEGKHESELLHMLDEERLRYTGSIVLGLNDALVELTGGLAGLTLALRNTRLIALSGLIVGIAAALSMAASEYLSTKAEKTAKKPLRSALYTGAVYVVVVLTLVLPYLFLANPYFCLGCTLAAAILIIAAFNYYISVARDEPFGKMFAEMAGVSLAVAWISFAIGYLLRSALGVEV